MSRKPKLTNMDAMVIGERAGIDWAHVDFSPRDLRVGIRTETIEHGEDEETAIAGSDEVLIFAKIAWRHLKESRFYYDMLAEFERNLAARERTTARSES